MHILSSQFIDKTSAKFQKDRTKHEGGVALTVPPHCVHGQTHFNSLLRYTLGDN